jgi:hypothetical protein
MAGDSVQTKRKRLEVTRLLWDFANQPRFPEYWGFDPDAPKEKRYYAELADHECPYAGTYHACGLYITDVQIDLGDNGKDICQIHHPEYTKSGTDHELCALNKLAANIFEVSRGELFHAGGGGVTYVNFMRGKGQRQFLDAGMDIFQRMFQLFHPSLSSRMIGPQIFRKTFFWSIELQGWIALEDRVAREYGLLPFNRRRSSQNPADISTYNLLTD